MGGVRRKDVKAAGGGKGEKIRMPASVVGSKPLRSWRTRWR